MKKMKTKDFIMVGLFAAIYLVLFMIGITIFGTIPGLYFYASAIISVFLATIYHLYLAKTGKKYSVIILGFIIVTIMALMMGGIWTVFVFGYLTVLIAEIIASIGHYKSFKYNTLSFMFFSLFPFGVYSAFWFLKERMLSASAAYGEAYAETVRSMINYSTLITAILATMGCALIGSLLAYKLFHKHFKQSGLIK